MATAYLLASVLTLLVVLVQGQKAIHEQEIQVKTDKLVEVADDIFEDELNSDIDFLLLGSANTRAECNQKKKCKNKGGTCQKKGNVCAGKSVKGCSKGCSCCLPEVILCKPSKKCKRANGACISRSECNGKIVAKGCKKPKNCKRTHVCCVQDGSTTEAPTCRGGSRCLTTDLCPNQVFTTNHVCDNCKGLKTKAPTDFVNKLIIQGTDNIEKYAVVSHVDFKDKPISIKLEEGNCAIETTVQTFSCDRVQMKWTCKLEGYCTSKSTLNGVYIQDSRNCPCPNPTFVKQHVCDDCKNGGQALTHTGNNREKGSSNTVLDDQPKISFEPSTNDDDATCKANRRAMAWYVFKNAELKWGPWVELGSCGNIQSALRTGHLLHELMNCYKIHPGKIWSEGQISQCPPNSPKDEFFPTENPEICMEWCTSLAGCTAFNYKTGETPGCYFRNCVLPVPEPGEIKADFKGYYIYTDYPAAVISAKNGGR